MTTMRRIIGGFVGLISGYVLGMLLGFVFVDPNSDLWAFFGAVFALLGFVLGLTEHFHSILPVGLFLLIGFYLSSLAGILIFGNPRTDDLLEITRTNAVYVSIAGSLLAGLIGVFVRTRIPVARTFLALLGGFLGGYFFGVVMKLAPFPSMIGWSPFIFGCGLVSFGIASLLQRAAAKKPSQTP